MGEKSESSSALAANPGERWLWLWSVPVGFTVRLIVIGFVYKGFLVPDRDHWEFGYEMGRIARSIAAGQGFGNPYFVPTGPTALITPVYPYLLAAVFQVFGIYTKSAALAILTVNSLFSALTSIPIYFIARRCFGYDSAKWASWIWAIFPYAVYFSTGCIWYYSLITFFVAALFLLALSLDDSTSLWAWGGVGFLWGVTALVNPAVLGVAPFLVGWGLYRLYRKKKNWTPPAIVATSLLVITITPWLVRNYMVFQQPVFLKDNFWMEFCVGNLGDDLHWWHGSVHPAGSSAEMAKFQALGEQGYMLEKRRLGIAYLKGHWGNFLLRSFRRMIFFWTGFWSFRREYLREEPLDPANILFCSTLSFLALVGLRRAFRDAREIAVPFALLLLAFPMVYYFTHPDTPYRHPMDPALVVLATFSVVSSLRSRRRISSNPDL